MPTIDLTINEARALAGIKKLQKANETVEQTFKRMAKAAADVEKKTVKAGEAGTRASKKMRSAFDPARLLSFTAGLVGVGSVSAAIATVIRAHDLHIKKLREITVEGRKASNEIVALAALQEGGTKAARVRAASRLATRFGITDRGEAFNTVQALQSARGGSFEAGLAAATTVFRATQLDIDIASAREAEIFGAGTPGVKPGGFIRRAFIGGQASGRSPKEIIKAAESVKFADDPDFGFALASGIAGDVGAERLRVIAQSTFKALTPALTSEAAAERFEAAGLGSGKATQEQRLQFLKGKGITTAEKLAEFGFGESRQIEGLVSSLRKIDEIARIQKQIVEKNVPGLLLKKRGDVEKELPNLARTRLLNTLQAARADEQAFGPRSGPALETAIEERIRGLALERSGLSTFGGFDLVDEQGRSTGFDLFQLRALAGFKQAAAGIPGRAPELERFEREESALREELGGFGFDGSMQGAARDLKSAAKNLGRAGPTLGRPDVDK